MTCEILRISLLFPYLVLTKIASAILVRFSGTVYLRMLGRQPR